jgi:hypothetical protein
MIKIDPEKINCHHVLDITTQTDRLRSCLQEYNSVKHKQFNLIPAQFGTPIPALHVADLFQKIIERVQQCFALK